jgi:hypothetical protein
LPPSGTSSGASPRPAARPGLAKPRPTTELLLRADALAVSLRAAGERISLALGKSLAAFVAGRGWNAFGHARLDDHARERFGRGGRWVRDLAALGRAVGALPDLGAALRGEDGGGSIGRVAARLLGGIASPESLPAWIARARSRTVRELRDEIRQARDAGSVWPPGDEAIGGRLGGGPEGSAPGAMEVPDTGTVPEPDAAAPRETGPACVRPSPSGTGISTGAVRAVERPCEPGTTDGAADVGGDDVATVSRSPEGETAPPSDARHVAPAGRVGRLAAPPPAALPSRTPSSTPDMGMPLDDEPGVLVRFLAPAPVRIAFDEALELYRSVDGGPGTVTAFLSSLVGEARGAGLPPDVDRQPLRQGLRCEVVERGLARTTDRWGHLPDDGDPSWAFALAGVELDRLAEVEAIAGAGGPAALDAQIRELLRLEDAIERRLGRLLMEMADRGAWSRLRFADLGHYAEQRLGLSRTAAEDRARLTRALQRHPRLREAYEDGRVAYEAARTTVRILDGLAGAADCEDDWVARARNATVKRLRDEARALLREPGRLEPLDDAAWHRSLERTAGTARRRVLRAGMQAAAEPAPDVFLRFRLPASLAGELGGAIDAARTLLERRAGEVPWDEPWPDPAPLPSMRAARMFSVRSRRVPSWVGFLALLEEFVLTWDASPPRRRDRIYARDGWRCMAPGCSSRRNLQVHHVDYLSRSGSDEDDNLVCLCAFHHLRGEHGDWMRVRGRAPTGLVWRLGRPDLADRFRNERRVATPTAPA